MGGCSGTKTLRNRPTAPFHGRHGQGALGFGDTALRGRLRGGRSHACGRSRCGHRPAGGGVLGALTKRCAPPLRVQGSGKRGATVAAASVSGARLHGHRQLNRQPRPGRYAHFRTYFRIRGRPGRTPPSRMAVQVSDLASCGAAGNRTRVLRRLTRASPCAVRYVSTWISRSREPAEMTIPVTV